MSSLFPPKIQPAPEPGASNGLHQGKWWIDAQGRWRRIAEMELTHVENVMKLLVSRAALYAMRETWPMYDYAVTAPDGAADGIEQEIAHIERNPEAWLKSTNLYRALKKRRKGLKREMKKIKPVIVHSERNPGWTWTDEQ